MNQEDHILEVIRTNLMAVVPDLDPRDILRERSLADLGCNSIDRAEIVTLTIEQLGVEVPVAEFLTVEDLGSLVELLRRYL